jgi:hypothetical protein
MVCLVSKLKNLEKYVKQYHPARRAVVGSMQAI